MALRFHARQKILHKFCPPSQTRPDRFRAKAALLNSRTTPSKELTGHVMIYSHVVFAARQINFVGVINLFLLCHLLSFELGEIWFSLAEPVNLFSKIYSFYHSIWRVYNLRL